jgi:hypothetical protein
VHVAVQEGAYIFVRRGNFIFVQYAYDNARIGHSGDLDVVEIVIDTETFFESRFERMHTRAARVDQRPIDIEKQKALCNCGLRIAGRGFGLHFCSGALPPTVGRRGDRRRMGTVANLTQF